MSGGFGTFGTLPLPRDQQTVPLRTKRKAPPLPALPRPQTALLLVSLGGSGDGAG